MRLHKSDSRQPPPSHQGLSAVSVALAFLICVGGNGTQQAAAQTLQGGVSTNEYAPAPAPAPSGPPTMPTGPTGAGDIGAGGTGAGDSFGLGGAIGGIVGGVLSGLLSHGNSAPAQRYDKTYGEIYQDAAQADAAIIRDAAVGHAADPAVDQALAQLRADEVRLPPNEPRPVDCFGAMVGSWGTALQHRPQQARAEADQALICYRKAADYAQNPAMPSSRAPLYGHTGTEVTLGGTGRPSSYPSYPTQPTQPRHQPPPTQPRQPRYAPRGNGPRQRGTVIFVPTPEWESWHQMVYNLVWQRAHGPCLSGRVQYIVTPVKNDPRRTTFISATVFTFPNSTAPMLRAQAQACVQALLGITLPPFPDRQCRQVQMGAATGSESNVLDKAWRPERCF